MLRVLFAGCNTGGGRLVDNDGMIELDSRVHWSVMVRGVGAQAPVLFSLNPDDVLKTASVGKLFLLAEVMRQDAAGLIGLDDVIDRDRERDDDYMEDSGLLYLLRQRRLRVADLCVLVGAFSDNYATNLLVEHVGLANVQRCARQTLGYTRSNLLDKVRWESRTPSGLPDDMSCGTARELADYMARLERGTLVGEDASRRIGRWLAADADTSMTSGAFNVDPLAHWPDDAGFALMHKTGTESDVRCDVGVVTSRATGTSICWAVLANWDKHRYGDLRDTVLHDMRAVGERIRAAVTEPDASRRERPWD